MNQLTTRTTAVFATAMITMIILGFAAVMTVSAQTEPERPTDLSGHRRRPRHGELDLESP